MRILTSRFTDDAPCDCAAAGWCPVFERRMTAGLHRICVDGNGDDGRRRQFRELWASRLPWWRRLRLGDVVHAIASPIRRRLGLKHEPGTVTGCRSCDRRRDTLNGVTKHDSRNHTASAVESQLESPEFTAGPDISGRVVNWYGRDGSALRDHLRGATVFLCGGGPSLNALDLSQLQQRGIVVAAINNVAATHVRPRFFFSVDVPRKFHPAIWHDPDVVKFTRREHSRGSLTTDTADGWDDSGRMVRDVGNVWFFESNKHFRPETFLTSNPVPWGGTYLRPDGTPRECRNSMLPALRLLYWMGCRRVVLIGTDFRMQAGQSYAFDEPKDAGGASYNNNSFDILNRWFTECRPHFAAAGFEVVNATPGSALTAFDRVDYQSAIDTAAAHCPPVDSVTGLYHR